jgi:hypothetical protein
MHVCTLRHQTLLKALLQRLLCDNAAQSLKTATAAAAAVAVVMQEVPLCLHVVFSGTVFNKFMRCGIMSEVYGGLQLAQGGAYTKYTYMILQLLHCTLVTLSAHCLI